MNNMPIILYLSLLYRGFVEREHGLRLYSALLVHDDMNAKTTGLVSELALHGMRTFSQKVFQRFREMYIDSSRNFLTDVDNTPDHKFFGDCENWLKTQKDENGKSLDLVYELLAARSAIKTFVLYQLTNREKPNGSGAGCGLYDQSGSADSGGISSEMNKYIFDVCFNPTVCKENIYHFADHCLRNLNSSYFGADHGEDGYAATQAGLAIGLNPEQLKQYWKEFGQIIKEQNLISEDRRVVTSNYTATYSKHLPKVFEVLDSMVDIEESVN